MSEHNSKTNDPKVFKLGEGMTLGYPTNDMVLWFRGHILGLGLRQQQYGVCSDSMSAFYLTWLDFLVMLSFKKETCTGITDAIVVEQWLQN